MKTQAQAIRESHHTAGQTARAADKLCVSSSRLAKLDRIVYTFKDGSKLSITKNQTVKVLPQ